jgi:hypothetical protein
VRRRNEPVRKPRSASNDESLTFRRSRTITGSTVSHITAASEARSTLQSPRLHEQSLRQHRKRLIGALLTALVLLAVCAYVVSCYVFGPVTVGYMSTQATTKPLDQQRYQTQLMTYFDKRPLERFSFFLDESALQNYFISISPELSDVRLERDQGLLAWRLDVKLRQPVVTWTLNDRQYFVDTNGVSFTVNYFGSPEVTVTDRSGIGSSAGVIASNRLLRFIGRVIALVDESDIPPVRSVELPSGSTRQVEFKLDGVAYPLRANLDRDPAGQAADIINAVHYVSEKSLSPAYVDVRVSGRAYYRDAAAGQ